MGAKPEIEGAETMSDEGTAATAPSGAPPVTGWDRYELLELLGHGGMGEVYKARDRRLGRIVAIKLILGADPNLAVRLAREARAQARIDHPHVCKVHEVGEVDGRPYIALQFVDGEPLSAAAARMTLDQKIAALRDVADAIQEAHRLGIVHRDLTPANVLVELTEAGRWSPVVVDFGLARETAVDTGLTRSGAVLGTPQYISPEQARGDIHAIDRRSDVYGLGAVLYELLTGRPPFADPSLAQLLARVIHDEPARPRSLVPSVPVDLETIALKCLAKDPAQRYASARALADDLGHYLAGEPILGRRPSLWRRLRMRARRHRAIVALGAASLVVVAVVAALGVEAWQESQRERARTAARTALAQQLGQDAKDIELFLRTAYQLPLQDTRPARDLMQQRMGKIAAIQHDLGPLGDAVIHDALGRGHLALHQWREAADELTRARDAGLDTPELHAARGQALGELYHRALDDARRSGDPAWLAARRAELQRQYLAPAMAELAQSRGAGDHAAYVNALIALYRDEFATAERTALAAAEHEPWLFEARKLAGDAAYGAALAAFDRGDYDAARPGLERAEALYAQASEVARSDASIYEAAAQATLQRAEIDARQGRSPREPLDRALAAIDRALRASPDDGPAYTTKAYVLLRWYRTSAPALYAADEAVPLLERIASAAARAVELDREDAGAWDALGNAHALRGNYESVHGGQGAAWWQRALDEIGQALAIRPGDPWGHNDLGVVHRWIGASLEEAGRDPLPEYQAALGSYDRATELDPRYAIAWSNMVDLHATITEYHASHGGDPRPDAERARRAGERCLAIDPSFDLVLDNMAQAQLSLASYLVDTGGDPSQSLATARGDLDRADQRHPGHMITWFHRLAAARMEASVRLRDHADPTAALATGRSALVEVLRLDPNSSDGYVEAARLDLIEAAATREHPAIAILERARTDAIKAAALDRQFADAQLIAAEACLQLAIARHSHDAARLGLGYADQALAINPQLARARELRAALARL